MFYFTTHLFAFGLRLLSFVFVFIIFMFNLRFCFVESRLYFRCARSFLIKLFVLNIKKINSWYVAACANLIPTCPTILVFFFGVSLEKYASAFTQIALSEHDNQGCTCPLIHYLKIGAQSIRLELIFLNFQMDHLGFDFMVMVKRKNIAIRKGKHRANNKIWYFV